MPLSCKRQEHQLVLQVAPNWCPTLLTLVAPIGASWLHILPLEDFDDLIKSSHLIIYDSSISFILVIFMLLTFLLGHKRICTICTCQCWLVWSKYLLGFPSYEPSENPHFHLPPLREQSNTEHLCVLFEWNARFLAIRHFDYHNTKGIFSCLCPSSSISFFIHIASLQACVAAMYSAYVVDNATIVWSLETQLTAPSAIMNT